MKNILKTGFATLLLLLAISCKKENTTIQLSGSTDESSAQELLTDINEPAVIEITIGTQVWMKRNWTGTRYRNGDRIPQVTDPAQWGALITGAWCWYNNDSAKGRIYGKLYNWYAVNDTRGLAPTGWHVPSDAEWTTLSSFLGGDVVAGGKMKSTGTAYDGTGLWRKPNSDATNSSGFTGHPGGFRGTGSFIDIGGGGYWWSSSEYDSGLGWIRFLSFYDGVMGREPAEKMYGLSVRLMKD